MTDRDLTCAAAGHGGVMVAKQSMQRVPTQGGRDADVGTFLATATRVVGNLFGNDAHCIEAVALLTEVAHLVGVPLDPMPVALAARHRGWFVALGRKAYQAWPEDHAHLPRGGHIDPRWRDAGHLVLLHRPSRLLLDPTLRQISGGLHYPLGPTTFGVATTEPPPEGFWEFKVGAAHLRYYLAPDAGAWRTVFASSREQCTVRGLPQNILATVQMHLRLRQR